MKELVAASGKRKSTLTEMANALTKRGYLNRENDPADARGVILVLTDKAWHLRPAFDNISGRLLEATWGDMPDEDRNTLVSLLDQVINNLKAQLRKQEARSLSGFGF
ncbi:MAG: hypothetical protein A2087_07880 [Spirochaetes bacterium GWD1_61_31]|nr:MAG: hypothetical protein A2Y37_06120 [Spirochaetes bacterium GWB1_60_80]OHD34980.1 MAG: hypothetical protein A2004_03945 [Spirochaetes bacterium GWC1_61_12]OHD40456.1 MAG: hypothetical protein A2087_07880 [Spirochaetes bacterium GWD1_61_31]OHD43071.1 MAG: hypothetical protein A2Y35_01495 [Spirochaetes bacterium GWE1_60_18]OHD59667.1 MAG: hypothetical protein A2Y32_12370 [Spirochaetes bacterium GWF1_60_12]HAP44106.1 hypothetical protein [Spirochaetaceae bacterium]